MAIVKMNKFTLLALESQKDDLLRELQLFGETEFINLQEVINTDTYEELRDLEKDALSKDFGNNQENLARVKYSIDFIKEHAPTKSGLLSMIEDKRAISYEELNNSITAVSWEETWKSLRNLDSMLSNLENERTKIEGEIEALRPWSNFDAPFDSLKELKLSSYFIGSISKQYEDKLLNEFSEKIKEGYIEIVSRNTQDTFLFLLTSKEMAADSEEILKFYGFSPLTINYNEKPEALIRGFKRRIDEIHKERLEAIEEIKSFKDRLPDLELVYEYYNSLLMRNSVASNFLRTKNTITIMGWIAEEKKNELEDTLNKVVRDNYYIDFEEPTEMEEDQVPIKLRNNSFSAAFEGIVEMYSLPLYKEMDPTPILSVFYVIFFGMMLSDAGYGLLMVIASAIAVKMVKDKSKKNSYKLFLYAGLSTVIWGAIYGSWFGDLLPSYLGIKIPYAIDPPNSITEILIISVIFGFIHIFVGLGMKGYMLIKSGHWKDAIYDVGTWYAILIGAVMLLLGLGTIGGVLLGAGLVGVLLTAGREYPSIGAKIGWGIYGVYGVTSYLGDIVSYSRLMALGLATGFIANAFNLVISLIPSPFSYILAPLLFLVFHVFNLLVNALGSYVHAARLQYLEFFNKFYEGGGKKFTPYKLSDEYIKITK
ncbi:MAG: V-type ATP synthase subunit I [Clostridiaceae bacterium]